MDPRDTTTVENSMTVVKPDNTDPVHYVPPHSPGWVAGWYFWNETWADRHGPFDSEEKAREELAIYVATQNGHIFVGLDGRLYAKDVWFENTNMGPFDNEQAAHNAYSIRASAEYLTHEGKWYFIHSGERFGPYDDRAAAYRAHEACVAMKEDEETRTPHSQGQLGNLLHFFGTRSDNTKPTKRTRDDMRTMAAVLAQDVTHFQRGDIISLHPLCGYYPKIRGNGGEAIFLDYLPRQKMKPDATPLEGLYAILEADCHLGYFDDDGDFIELYADSRFFTLAETSN
jgi:hypothetical protein